MNKLTLILLLLTLSVCQLTANGIERHYIRFQEKAIQGFSPTVVAPMPDKSERTSSSKGCIVMTFDPSVPDSIRVALNAAKEAWEAKLPASQEIYINATMESLDPNISMQTYVGYCPYGEYQGAPCALASQLIGAPQGNMEEPDSYIFLNQNLSWNCNFSSDQSPGYNVYTVALRGIAISLGFGSSVCRDYDNPLLYIFSSGSPTYFDNNIYKDNVCLKSLQNASPDLSAFITSNALYVKGNKFKHSLYAPTTFIPGVSLIYLDDNTSLMHYAIGEGDKMLSIDANTLDILNGIGWDFAIQQVGASIKCNDISSDGIGSSYTSHTFTLDNSQGANEYEWTFSLKSQEGRYMEVSHGTNNSFTIESIQSPDKYYINTNGDLDGKIECRYTAGNKSYTAKPFYVSLELKPLILSVDNMERIPAGDFSYYLTFTVQYRGADKLQIATEEEYSSIQSIQDMHEPFIAHVKTYNLSTLRYSWITIHVRNKYGSADQTLEFAPEIPTGLEDITTSLTEENTCILNLDGISVSHVFNPEITKSILPRGVYINRAVDKNGRVKTQKFIIK